MKRLRLAVIALALILTPELWAQSAPPAPAPEVPDIQTVKIIIVCGDCDQPFDTSTHDNVLDGLVSNTYIGELRKALYLQDTYHQFESKAHFDNCDFDEAIAYIDSLLAEVNQQVIAAKSAKDQGDTQQLDVSVKKAFFALGQALHGVQDFYAHSNYVELSVGQVKKSTDIPVVRPWTPTGKDLVKELLGKGLISGYVFWGLPQKCASGSISHADLAKDKATTKSGTVKVQHLQNQNQYQIAVQLAKAASQKLIDDAFKRWPILKEVNGKNVAFEILVDRRGL